MGFYLRNSMHIYLILGMLYAVIATSVHPWAVEFLKLTNDARAKVGAPPLCLNQKLNKIATRYSKYLKGLKTLTHDGPNGEKTIGERAKKEGFKFQSLGENLASPDGPERAFKRLMDSPGHKKNILDPKFNMMGVGGCSDSKVHEGKWVQLFAKSSEPCIKIGRKSSASASASASSGKARSGENKIQGRSGGSNSTRTDNSNKARSGGKPAAEKSTKKPAPKPRSSSAKPKPKPKPQVQKNPVAKPSGGGGRIQAQGSQRNKGNGSGSAGGRSQQSQKTPAAQNSGKKKKAKAPSSAVSGQISVNRALLQLACKCVKNARIANLQNMKNGLSKADSILQKMVGQGSGVASARNSGSGSNATTNARAGTEKEAVPKKDNVDAPAPAGDSGNQGIKTTFKSVDGKGKGGTNEAQSSDKDEADQKTGSANNYADSKGSAGTSSGPPRVNQQSDRSQTAPRSGDSTSSKSNAGKRTQVQTPRSSDTKNSTSTGGPKARASGSENQKTSISHGARSSGSQPSPSKARTIGASSATKSSSCNSTPLSASNSNPSARSLSGGSNSSNKSNNQSARNSNGGTTTFSKTGTKDGPVVSAKSNGAGKTTVTTSKSPCGSKSVTVSSSSSSK